MAASGKWSCRVGVCVCVCKIRLYDEWHGQFLLLFSLGIFIDLRKESKTGTGTVNEQ